MVGSMSYEDQSLLQINDKCSNANLSPGNRKKAGFRAGECVSLSCNGAPNNCSNITWLFSNKNGHTEALFENGMVKSEDNKDRLCVTKECSLELKKLRKEDEGVYTCRAFPSSGGAVDHAQVDLEIIPGEVASTSTPTTTGPATEPPSQELQLGVGVALGTAALLIVALVLLIRWHRRRGNQTPKDTTIGLNSISDAPPVRSLGAIYDEHLSVDVDQDGGPTYASIVLPEGQRAVGTAQVEDDSSNAVTYASVRASPRCGEKAGDVDVVVHHGTVRERAK